VSGSEINDVIDVSREGITVRSHRTKRDDFIGVSIFETWWEHLIEKGSASLRPGHSNNPHRYRSRIVGAIMAAGLSGQIGQDKHDDSVVRLVRSH
jgi:hypothetical protein